LRVGIEAQQTFLRGEQHTVPRLLVNFNLRMVWSHVALRARPRQTRNGHRAGMSRVASSAISECSVGVRLADGMTLSATAGNRGRALELRNGIWRALHIARIVLFSGRHLLRRQALLSHNRGPGCCSVPAARKLLVDLLVTGTAISCGHVRGDYK